MQQIAAFVGRCVPLRCLAHRENFSSFWLLFSHQRAGRLCCHLPPMASTFLAAVCRHCSIPRSLPRERGNSRGPSTAMIVVSHAELACNQQALRRTLCCTSSRGEGLVLLYVLNVSQQPVTCSRLYHAAKHTPSTHIVSLICHSSRLYYHHPGTPSNSRDMTRYISNALRPALCIAATADWQHLGTRSSVMRTRCDLLRSVVLVGSARWSRDC